MLFWAPLGYVLQRRKTFGVVVQTMQPTPPEVSVSEELLNCPFCGGSMRIVSNRDWHKLCGDHAADCFIVDQDVHDMVPATDTERAALVSAWNRRTNRDGLGGEG